MLCSFFDLSDCIFAGRQISLMIKNKFDISDGQ